MNDKIEKESVEKKVSISPYGKAMPKHKNGENSFYEAVIMLRSEIASQDASDLVKKLMSVISEYKGETKKVEYWGLRSLKYKIKKNRKSHYYCISFEGKSDLVNELNRILKIDNATIRHLILRLTFIDLDDSPMLRYLKTDIENDQVIYDEKYLVKCKSSKSESN